MKQRDLHALRVCCASVRVSQTRIAGMMWAALMNSSYRSTLTDKEDTVVCVRRFAIICPDLEGLLLYIYRHGGTSVSDPWLYQRIFAQSR